MIIPNKLTKNQSQFPYKSVLANLMGLANYTKKITRQRLFGQGSRNVPTISKKPFSIR